MALIRLAYAADLPPTDKLVRDSDGRRRARAAVPGHAGAGSRTCCVALCRRGSATTRSARAANPTTAADPHTMIRSLEDIAALAQANGAPVLKVHIENDIHLVQLEPGRWNSGPAPARRARWPAICSRN